MRRLAAAIFLIITMVPAAADATAACQHRLFEQTRFLVCPYDSRTQKFELILADAKGAPLRNLRLATARVSGVRFAMNAGMYQSDGRPVGLYIENSKSIAPLNTEHGTGNFYLTPNGVFAVAADGTVTIASSESFQRDTTRWATQSGPMLVIHGKLHPAIAPDGESKFVRNGVGRADAHTALFVISEDPVSFGRLARFFRDGLSCPDALYLDGVVASLWWPAGGRRDEQYPLGPMVVVSDRP